VIHTFFTVAHVPATAHSLNWTGNAYKCTWDRVLDRTGHGSSTLSFAPDPFIHSIFFLVSFFLSASLLSLVSPLSLSRSHMLREFND